MNDDADGEEDLVFLALDAVRDDADAALVACCKNAADAGTTSAHAKNAFVPAMKQRLPRT